MIEDYSVYTMTPKERLLFFTGGYAVIAFIIFLFYHNIFLCLLSGFSIFKLDFLYSAYMVSRRTGQLNMQFKDMLYSMSASVSSGRQMSEAIVEAHENLKLMYSDKDLIMQELHYMRNSIKENNESDAILLADFARRSHHEDINNFVQVYLTCRNLGGDLDDIIMRTSMIISEKMAIKREIQVLMAQKKLEGRIIAAMPLAMLLMLNIASPSYIAPLYETISGKLIMTGALAASLFGLFMIEKIALIEL